MTKYVELMEQADAATKMATNYLLNGELELALFYKNAAEGLKQRALNLEVETCSKSRIPAPVR